MLVDTAIANEPLSLTRLLQALERELVLACLGPRTMILMEVASKDLRAIVKPLCSDPTWYYQAVASVSWQRLLADKSVPQAVLLCKAQRADSLMARLRYAEAAALLRDEMAARNRFNFDKVARLCTSEMLAHALVAQERPASWSDLGPWGGPAILAGRVRLPRRTEVGEWDGWQARISSAVREATATSTVPRAQGLAESDAVLALEVARSLKEIAPDHDWSRECAE